MIKGWSSESAPATEWMAVTSSASDSVSGGSSPGRRCASIVLPIPGGNLVNNYLAVMLRNWARAGRLNRFSRVILAPRAHTPGRININTVVTANPTADRDDRVGLEHEDVNVLMGKEAPGHIFSIYHGGPGDGVGVDPVCAGVAACESDGLVDVDHLEVSAGVCPLSYLDAIAVGGSVHRCLDGRVAGASFAAITTRGHVKHTGVSLHRIGRSRHDEKNCHHKDQPA